jgi:pimeloyl-ACP methyl ester carboxylesterase
MRTLPSILTTALVVASATAQNYAPPPNQPPDAATLKSIVDKTEKLNKALVSLRRQGVKEPLFADVDIYHKAAVWIVRHHEFYQKDAGAWTLDVLDRGLLRAHQLAQGETPWLHQTGHDVVRAYHSRVDGSVQPFAVCLPTDYGKDPRKKWRLDVVLHGRDTGLTEVKFLTQHADKPAAKDQNFIRLDIFGRGNNAYRWAGETDVYEAIDAFLAMERLLGRGQFIDPARVVLRGFSMGGAGTWHLGLHRPDRWCVLGPGAGFTNTHGYIPKLPEVLPPYQEPCLRIYDAVDYAENAFNVPIVAYSGDKDAQMAAARNIESLLAKAGLAGHMTHIVAPGLGHTFPPEWQQKAEAAYRKFTGPGRPEYPNRVRFVTYTLKYPSCAWVEILALDKHYERAVVDAGRTERGFIVTANPNVRALKLTLPHDAPQGANITINEQTVVVPPWNAAEPAGQICLERQGDRWHAVLPQKLLTDRLRRPRKTAGLQGPIDDAFCEGFLCVRGTGKGWHDATALYAAADLERFRSEWHKHMRGELPVIADIDVTAEDVASKNLILFGDPASNTLIAQVVDGLPLQWTSDAVTLGGTQYPASEHVPALIHPNPLNPGRYVVLNSGHTFHEAEFHSTNAQLYPRLGDYAVIRVGKSDPLAADIAAAGLFDEHFGHDAKR